MINLPDIWRMLSTFSMVEERTQREELVWERAVSGTGAAYADIATSVAH